MRCMRIMLMWPSSGLEMKILLDALASAGHEVVYWVGEYSSAHLSPKGAIFHDHYDAWDAKRPETLKNAPIEPVSKDMIASMFETESLVLTMMNKRYDAAPVDERKHIYYTMLAYWNYVVEETEPDVIIYNTVPHSIYSNIVYDLAKKNGIQTLTFEETWVAGRILIYRDFWKGSEELRKAIQVARDTAVTTEDLHPDLRQYYELQKNPTVSKTPWYMVEQRSVGAGIGLWTHRAQIALRAPRKILSRAIGLLNRSFKPDLKKEYELLTRAPDFSLPYVYFPLNFQPERTTSPQGGIFHDQILAAETLAAALPTGWELYIKEHPSQWWLRGKTRYSSARYRGYYKRLAEVPHTRLVPIYTDTFELLAKSKTVATVTGTAGWEALLRGKPVLVFGIPWYRDCPGVSTVQTVHECKKAFIDVDINNGVPEKDILTFLKALEETGTRAHPVAVTGVSPEISMEESMRAISKTLIRELARSTRRLLFRHEL